MNYFNLSMTLSYLIAQESRLIFTTIIYKNDFVISKSLAQYASHTRKQERFDIIYRNYDR